MDKSTFIEKIINKNIHIKNGELIYGYSLIPDIFTISSKIKIICPEHGEFEQIANSHIFGKGCFKCGVKSKTKFNEFLLKAKEIHGEKYDYSKVVYKNNRTKIVIICPIHGEFEQLPQSHTFYEHGCPKCAIDKQRKPKEQFIEEANKVHNNFYDYSLVDYQHSEKKIKIICPKHGEFEQTPSAHLTCNGCPKCSIEKLTKTTEQFIEEANKVHNNFYDYSLVDYKKSYEKIIIICPKHGKFEQLAQSHLRGQGCIQCAKERNVSLPELSVRKFINKLGFKTDNNSIHKLKNFEIDIFVEKLNIGFEFNGVYFHSIKYMNNNYHNAKYKKALSKQIKLFHIFEDEWLYKRDCVYSFIIKKLLIKEKLQFIDNFSRNNINYDSLIIQQFLENNDKNYIYTLNDDLIYHCLFDENNEIIKCYIINDKTKTIINIVEKNYVVVNDNINYFSGYNLMIDLFYDSPLEEKYKYLKIKRIINFRLIWKKNYKLRKNINP